MTCIRLLDKTQTIWTLSRLYCC